MHDSERMNSERIDVFGVCKNYPWQRGLRVGR